MSPFPLDALPKALADLARTASLASGFPAEFVAVSGLSVLGAAIGGRAELELSSDFRVKSIIWTSVAAPPGSGKTPGTQIATAPLRRMDGHWFDVHRASLEDYQLQVSMKAAGDPPLSPPRRRRCLIGDSTIEAIAPTLVENPGAGMLWEQSEIAAIIGALDQYHSKGRGAGRPSFLALWDGRDLQVDRIQRGSLYVPSPLVCVTGGVQPARLEVLLIGGDGLGARFLIEYLPDAGIATPVFGRRADHRAHAAWDDLIFQLLVDPDHGIPVEMGDPTLVQFGRSATVAWAAAMRAFKRRWQDARATNHGQQVVAKAPLQLARLGLSFHVADHPEQIPSELHGDTVERALAVVDHFIEAALNMSVTEASAAASLSTRRLDEGVQILLDWLRRRPGQVARSGDLLTAHVAGCRIAEETRRLIGRYAETFPGCVSEERREGVNRGPLALVVRTPEGIGGGNPRNWCH